MLSTSLNKTFPSILVVVGFLYFNLIFILFNTEYIVLKNYREIHKHLFGIDILEDEDEV